MVTNVLTISCVKNNALKWLTDKLRANKISLNESKIKQVIFRPRRKLNMINNFTYLRIVINKNISWKKRTEILEKNPEKNHNAIMHIFPNSIPPAGPATAEEPGAWSPHIFAQQKEKEKQSKKRKSLKAKLLKDYQKSQNVTTLAVLERLEFRNFSCWRIMVADRYFWVFHGPSTLISISPAPTRFMIFCYVLTLFFSINFCQGKF